MRARWLLGLLAVVVGAVALAIGVVALITGGGKTLVLDLDPGSCLDLPSSVGEGGVGLVDTVACTDPHEAEVYAVGELPAASSEGYPGERTLLGQADQRCAGALDAMPGAAQRFGVLPVVPDEASWSHYRGRYVCIAVPYGGGAVTGSVTPTPAP